MYEGISPYVDFCNTVTDVSADECQALMSVYDNTGGDNWNTKNGW